MAQEFVIKSQNLEDKINQLLPSQGGFQAGVDLSASTQIIPIVDLTETAEGSTFRQDLQRASSLTANTEYQVNNATTTLINTTGYFLITGTSSVNSNISNSFNLIQLTDGTTTKIIWGHRIPASSNFTTTTIDLNIMVFLEAGHQLVANSTGTAMRLAGCTRQIADISGNLIDP